MGAHRGAHSRALGAAFGRRAIPARSRLRSRAPRVRLLPRACLPRSAGLRLAWLSPARLGQPRPASLLLAPLPLIRPLSYSVPRPPFSSRPLRGQGGRPPPTIPARGLRLACSLRSRPALAALAGGRRSPPCRAARAACPTLLRPLVIVAAGAPLGPRNARGRPRCSRPRGALAAAPPLYPPRPALRAAPRSSGGLPLRTRASPVAHTGFARGPGGLGRVGVGVLV